MKESILWPILEQARNCSINGTNFDIDKFHNKFAELIVRECMSVIGEENYGMLTGKANCTELKRHFGVDNK